MTVLQSCPNCGWRESRRSSRAGKFDFVLACLFLVPHRCHRCRTRFFRFSLPSGIAPKPEAPAPVAPRALEPDQPAAQASSVLADPAPTPSVLILAEDVPVRRLLRRILERDGYQIHELAEPVRLGAELRARPVDLVIADLDLSAEDTIRILEPLLPGLDSRMVVLSSEAVAADEISHSCVVIEKPFRSETLLAQVRSVLCMTR